jgi:hypothetical protein
MIVGRFSDIRRKRPTILLTGEGAAGSLSPLIS